MAKQDLNLGTVADDGTGDKLRTGGQKIKDNFDELYAVKVPAGGTAGQLLAKASPADGDFVWADAPEAGISIPPGGAAGQILAKASGVDYDVAWVDAPSGGGGGSGLDKDRWAPPALTDFPTLLGTNSVNPNVDYSSTAGMTLGHNINNVSGQDNVRACVKSISGSSWTVIARVRVCHRAINFCTGGLVLRDSSSGKMIQFGYDTTILNIIRWNSQSSYSAAAWTSNSYMPQGPEWFKITYDGTDLRFWISQNGTHWMLVYTESATAFLAAVDQVGFATHVYQSASTWHNPASGDDMFVHVFYYDDPDISAAAWTP
jgi:hypothetical protein